ncbi:uncharacterized protein METZ01_LOCUS382706, partial [marine metagenome]
MNMQIKGLHLGTGDAQKIKKSIQIGKGKTSRSPFPEEAVCIEGYPETRFGKHLEIIRSVPYGNHLLK